MSLAIVPVTLREANAFVALHHRHHRPARGCRAALGVARAGELVGVAILGRPVARHYDDGQTLEVTRVATDGTRNACSKLYGASWRVARALGYRRLITYTLKRESGSSLRAVGWRAYEATSREGKGWSRPSRARIDKHPLELKIRWEATE